MSVEKLLRRILCAAALGTTCSGCLLRLEHNTTSPGAKGVVLDAETGAPLAGAHVVVSRLCGMEPPTVSDALTNTRPPVVTTRKSGRFHVAPEREWRVVLCLVERFRRPGGTLVVERAEYQSAAIPLWGEVMPLSVQPTNFLVVALHPATKCALRCPADEHVPAKPNEPYRIGMSRDAIRVAVSNSCLVASATRPTNGWSSRVTPPAGSAAAHFEYSRPGVVAQTCDVYWLGHTNRPTIYYWIWLYYFYFDTNNTLIGFNRIVRD